jgi:hypothetical protein
MGSQHAVYMPCKPTVMLSKAGNRTMRGVAPNHPLKDCGSHNSCGVLAAHRRLEAGKYPDQFAWGGQDQRLCKAHKDWLQAQWLRWQLLS